MFKIKGHVQLDPDMFRTVENGKFVEFQIGMHKKEGKFARKITEPGFVVIEPKNSNRKSPGAGSKSESKKNKTSPPNAGSKVSVTVALDQDVSIINDLPDYKKELQRLNTIIDQIEDKENIAQQCNDPQIVDNETKPNNEDLNEALRTAKKIAKALVSGLVRQGPQE